MEYRRHQVSGLLSFFIDGTRSRLVGANIRSGQKVLDIGCGNGLLIPYLPPQTAYTGVELNPEILDWLKKQYPSFEFYQGRAGIDPLPPGPFDAVILAGVVEHLEPELHGALFCEIRKVVHPEGRVIVTTPTPFGGRFHKAISLAGIASREAAREHKVFLSKKELSNLFERSGFQVMMHRKYFLGMAHYVIASPR